MTVRPPLQLSKHHGAGNDFLVLLDLDDRRPFTGGEVRALCDRRRGVGGDGLLRAVGTDGGADVAMVLNNADGSPAEMSGNGIRCLVQAAVDAGVVATGPVRVATAAGVRTVDYRPGPEPGLAFASVDMGPVALGAELRDGEELARRLVGWPGTGTGPGAGAGGAAEMSGVGRGRFVSTGNPHLVLWSAVPVDETTAAVVGPGLEAGVPGGCNVEFVWPGPGPDELGYVVWERGAGLTLACGTGSCAAAAAAHAWGVVGTRVAVHNPGGTLRVTLAGGRADLAGPTRRVADVRVDEDVLAASVCRRGGSGEREAGPVR